MNTSNRFRLTVFSSVFALGVLLVLPMTTQAAGCQFTRDMQLGVMSPEVKCLQQYLNGNGFKVSETGVGSAGKETGEYKLLTEAAVIKWQKANGVSPASGFFGAKSRAKYTELVSGGLPVKQVLGASTSTVGASGTMSALEAQVAALMSQLSGNKPAETTKPALPTAAPVTSVLGSLKAALDEITDAESTIDDNADADEIDSAHDSMTDARSDLYKGLRAMISGDSSKAEVAFKSALNNAKDANEYAGGTSAKQDAADQIKIVKDLIKKISTLIEEATDAGKSTKSAATLLSDATDVLSDAQSSYKSGDYEDSLDYGDEAEGLLNDAKKAVSKSTATNTTTSSLTKRLADVQAALKSAKKKVTAADNNDDDIGDALSFLKSATTYVDAAKTAITVKDDAKSKKNLDKAETAIEDALDEL